MNHSIPVLWVGPPGVGKTQIVISKYDYTEVVLLSTMTEEDIAGLPYHINGVEARTEPPMFRRLREAASAGKTTAIFFDELDKARREVADTLLTLIASRRIGEWSLPPSCDIIAAANPPEWGGGDGISQAMRSRFSVRTFVPNVNNWCNWFKSQWKNTEHEDLANEVAALVEVGEIPLLDVSGVEGEWSWRLTCPRTLDMAFRAALNSPSKDERSELVRGLLSGVAADQMLRVFDKSEISKEESRARQTLINFSRKPFSKTSKISPIRIINK